MFVYKRDNTKTPVKFDEILDRIQEMTLYPTPLEGIDCAMLTKEVIGQLISGMTTREIDLFTAQRAASKSLVHLDYEKLGARILVNNHHKCTLPSFSAKMALLQQRVDQTGEVWPLLDAEFYRFIQENAPELDSFVDYERDYAFDYFGFSTLYEQSYLLRLDDKVVERPQDTILRIATFIHYDFDDVKGALSNIQETYNMWSQMYFTHASPTIFNAGLTRAGCISCFLTATDDSREGIIRTVSECVGSSASCGGIAFSASLWRNRGSLIRSSGGKSNGIVPFIQFAQSGVNAFNQGSRRRGSLAVYLHMHHPDLEEFLLLRKHGGDETQRSRDTFIALWISDLFMERMMKDEMWSFFDPRAHPKLYQVYGEEYQTLYEKLESQQAYVKQKRARELWKLIYDIKLDSGIPYMMAADQVNRANNHAHIGPIHNSNLCTEIVEYCENKDTHPELAQTACCTLSSIALPMFVKDKKGVSNEFPIEPYFDYNELIRVIAIVVRNLNKIIDKSYYPSEAARRGSQLHRPIGIGVQGLADVFHKFKIPFSSPAAKELNKRIFETLYYAAISESSKLARELAKKNLKTSIGQKDLPNSGGAYSTFWSNGGCYLSRGVFNYQLYGLNDSDLLQGFDWDTLRSHVMKFGTRNSLVIAIMPTQSTSQMFRNTEYCEPSVNVGIRKVMGGEYFCINKHLFHELNKAQAWTPEFVNYIKKTGGSVQPLINFDASFKERYKTVWEIPQKDIIDMAADRQPFVDQSQSMNLYFSNFTFEKFSASHQYGWKKKLKTLSYYVRQEPESKPFQPTLLKNTTFTPEKIETPKLHSTEELSCQVCGT